MISKIIKNYINFLFVKRLFRIYTLQFKKYCKHHNVKDLNKDEKKKYKERWGQLCSKMDFYSSALFKEYGVNFLDVVPEHVGRGYIERYLNPISYQGYYGDKNTYDMYLSSDFLPTTIVRKINGQLFDKKYSPIKDDELYVILQNIDKFIIKPSVDSGSGHGVKVFNKSGDQFKSKDNEIFNLRFLENYCSNFIIQEIISQHSEIARFCKTSINTIRIAVYKSVADGISHVVGSIMRIGKNGEVVDNAHAGGVYVGINIETGVLTKTAFDQFGNKYTSWNDIDFQNREFYIPNWDKIKEFALNISRSNPHLHLLALDIALNNNGSPKLIEYNVDGFSYWLYMFCGQSPLGKYTDEIIDYCKRQIPIVKIMFS